MVLGRYLMAEYLDPLGFGSLHPSYWLYKESRLEVHTEHPWLGL